MLQSDRKLQEFQTLVFFDLETTGLFDAPARVDSGCSLKVIPGDTKRDMTEIFKVYANKVDNHNLHLAPHITEISFVAVHRRIYKNGICRVHQKSKTLIGKKNALKVDIPIRVFAQQINPDFTEDEWKLYEKRQASTTVFNLSRADLECQPTFHQSWPLIHAFLSALEGPVALIAHNGLRFDCRVLLAELRRNNLLQSYPIPPSVSFVDSYIAFLDIEHGYHADISAVTASINWRLSMFSFNNFMFDLFSNLVLRKRGTIVSDSDEVAKKEIKQMPEKIEEQQGVNVCSAENGDIVPDGNDLNQSSGVERPLPTLNKNSPVRPNQGALLNVGWKTAPARLSCGQYTTEELSGMHPLKFMRTDTWSPAKGRRLRNDFFDVNSDGDWSFNSVKTNHHFYMRGNFRLTRLFSDIVGGSYLEHQALDDSIALMQVCLAYGQDFLNYVDQHSVKLEPLCATCVIY